MTFILRLVPDDAGGINGILELVKTGRKARFRGLDTLGSLIAQMIDEAGPAWTCDRGESPPAPSPPPRSTVTNMALIRARRSQAC